MFVKLGLKINAEARRRRENAESTEKNESTSYLRNFIIKFYAEITHNNSTSLICSLRFSLRLRVSAFKPFAQIHEPVR